MIFLKKRVFKYIAVFGLYHGLKTFFKIRASKNDHMVSLSLPGLVHPVFLRPDTSDISVFEEVFIDQQYHTSHPGISTIIDAGANIGLSALYFLKKHPSAKIICLEPEESNFNLLKMNLGNYKNAVLLKKALWHSKQHLNIINKTADKWAFKVEAAGHEPGVVEGLSVYDIMNGFQILHADLIKIDIEGAEKDVFGSNTSWLKKVKYLIVEIHDHLEPAAFSSVINTVLQAGFTCKQQSAQYFFSKVND